MATTTKQNRRSAVVVGLIASAADLGYNTRAGFQLAVESARRLVPSNYLTLLADKDEKAKAYSTVIREFGLQYKAGHLVAYLEPHYGAKRWGNMGRAERIESALEILDKAEPESEKGNRRTALEHKGARAAISAWSHLKGEAGLKPVAAPRPKTGAKLKAAAGDEKTVPTSAITPPKFTPETTPVDVVAYFDRLSSDLLNKVVNGNAQYVPIGIKSAVADFRKAIRAAVAGSKRTVKAKATKGTVSAAQVAAAMQNGKPNGASVQ